MALLSSFFYGLLDKCHLPTPQAGAANTQSHLGLAIGGEHTTSLRRAKSRREAPAISALFGGDPLRPLTTSFVRLGMALKRLHGTSFVIGFTGHYLFISQTVLCELLVAPSVFKKSGAQYVQS